jgi:hypothetical protein
MNINSLKRHELVKLVNALKSLSEENEKFCESFFDSCEMPDFEKICKTRKKKVFKLINNFDYDDYIPDYDFEAVERSLKSFEKKYTDYPGAVIDLYIYAVEIGQQITLEYGDIDEDYYISLEDWFEKAVNMVREYGLTEKFEESLKERVEAVTGMGWGHYDHLADVFCSIYPDVELSEVNFWEKDKV